MWFLDAMDIGNYDPLADVSAFLEKLFLVQRQPHGGLLQHDGEGRKEVLYVPRSRVRGSDYFLKVIPRCLSWHMICKQKGVETEILIMAKRNLAHGIGEQAVCVSDRYEIKCCPLTHIILFTHLTKVCRI